MTYIKKIVLFLLATILAYLLFYPVPIDPKSWSPPENIGFSGKYESNNSLRNMNVFFTSSCSGCEDIAIGDDGIVYGASATGDIVAMNLKTQKTEVIVNTGGRPLGLHFNSSGNLIIADAIKGLLVLDIKTSGIDLLTDRHGKRVFGFTDDLETDSDDNIYFTDASDKFRIHDYKLDLIEHAPNGRLLKYNQMSGQTELLLDSLYFANGVAVDHSESFVLVNETGKYRVIRYWLNGIKKGQKEIFIDNLPGFPDGISAGENGIFWLSLISPRKKALDAIMSKPIFRKMLVRLPDFMQPKPGNYNCILGLNDQAEIIHNLQSSNPALSQIASVQQAGDSLFFGSLTQNGIGIYPLER